MSRELQLVQRVVFFRDSVMCMGELPEWLDTETSHLAGCENDLEQLLCFFEGRDLKFELFGVVITGC